MTTLDLRPAADEIARLAARTADDQLADPTPCTGTSVGDMLDHVMGLSLAFRDAAAKSTTASAPPPPPSRDNLPEDWRSVLTDRLDHLVEAWSDESAWEGTATAGGVEMPAHIAGLVTTDELVLHGWDLAKGTRQEFHCDDASARAVYEFTSNTPRSGPQREGLFGPVVDVPNDAPLLDQALGLSGRDPAWCPPAGAVG
jgi:uncharacterized protein (TIGR03086 family)